MLTEAELGKILLSLYFTSLCSRDLLYLYTTYGSGVLSFPKIISNNFNSHNSHDSGNNSPSGSPDSYLLAHLVIFELIPCSLKHLKVMQDFFSLSSRLCWIDTMDLKLIDNSFTHMQNCLTSTHSKVIEDFICEFHCDYAFIVKKLCSDLPVPKNRLVPPRYLWATSLIIQDIIYILNKTKVFYAS